MAVDVLQLNRESAGRLIQCEIIGGRRERQVIAGGGQALFQHFYAGSHPTTIWGGNTAGTTMAIATTWGPTLRKLPQPVGQIHIFSIRCERTRGRKYMYLPHWLWQ